MYRSTPCLLHALTAGQDLASVALGCKHGNISKKLTDLLETIIDIARKRAADV